MERAEVTDILGERSPLTVGLLTIFVVAALYPLSRHNYLLYHGIVELSGIAVSLTFASIGWNTRSFARNDTLLVLAMAYLPVSIIDFMHVIGYKGMGVFPGNSSDPATQLWIAARYLESAGLLWAASLLGRRCHLRPGQLLGYCLSAGLLVVVLIVHWRIFPVCFVEGVGLTPFKVGSEYLICLLLTGAGIFFWRRRRHFDRRLLHLMLASVAVTILSELSFTLYDDVFGVSNIVGHIFKLFSVVLVYLALVRGSLTFPYRSLFRELASELAQRKASEEQLQTANCELDAFVHTVSHDLRTPLTMIIGCADYLQATCKEQLAEEKYDILGDIVKSGRSMTTMMEDLLTLAKVGSLKPPTIPVNTEAVVCGVLLELAGALAETGVRVEQGTLPAIRIPQSQLRQIFSNLLENAMRYGAAGGLIEVGGDCEGEVVRFYVCDHGPGIPEDERGHIFDLFYRGSTGEGVRGSGAGLAIVKKVAQLYKGRAWVDETLGGGATFWVELAAGGSDSWEKL